ncbi:class A beta-lactamase-related serine hydrolase [Mesorhizobium sp. M2D.F.Ca.ET.185.01.1.1]|uniref:serine hydrolase domain-containing protein n=1 Tax=unclassified Mesorhizobium TaxID=325217 RepID=UPI000FCB5968|nr:MULTISPECIES: serine hydrolase domain-containing protein [unclassified Mesorhizobium]TGP77092.1 class A beta-lactamase-related serine hydrolase [bacterium M00.F.Ca.ET.227.01.1.1]TGP84041.1 class A beta-lactamase-related serine hydrolase [bacterium M00.F.Ca.ET.221.01.1.1]TGP88608.1 class A beta-lactamase-related serine hydrolase [bacterium M00.F.Ca.ET.222.01.1.1]TGU03115.1 class A beta-lactamase-related serine hydrolase [bacterium M00.F.Ca.ET.163.01.1.1]TGU30839.1 class A beta-lactamase-rela
MNVDGNCDPRFAGVRDAFAWSFAQGLEHGGGVSVVVEGRTVVDLWGGHADAARTRPWRRDTLINVWSSTKGVVALAIAMLVERGKLDYAAPVARYWPEFAAGGKERITLDQVMSHQSGLNGLAVSMDEAGLLGWTPYTDALAAMPPLWDPGSRCVYHALSYGHLAGEVLRRVDGRSVGRFVAEEIAGPIGADFHIGLPEPEDSRVAEMIEGPKTSDWVEFVRASPFPQACDNPAPRALAPNDRAWRAAEVPGGNGQSTAHALARIYGMMATGGAFEGTPLIGRAAIEEATRPRFRGMDDSFALPAAFAAGYQIEDPVYGGRASPQTFGHTGWGGAVGFADPGAAVGFGYVTNRMLGFDDLDPRRKALIDAVYDAL